jgi:hypothetical protein
MKSTPLMAAAVVSVVALAPLARCAERIGDRPFRDENRRVLLERERERRPEKEPPLRGALIMAKTNAPTPPKR